MALYGSLMTGGEDVTRSDVRRWLRSLWKGLICALTTAGDFILISRNAINVFILTRIFGLLSFSSDFVFGEREEISRERSPSKEKCWSACKTIAAERVCFKFSSPLQPLLSPRFCFFRCFVTILLEYRFFSCRECQWKIICAVARTSISHLRT